MFRLMWSLQIATVSLCERVVKGSALAVTRCNHQSHSAPLLLLSFLAEPIESNPRTEGHPLRPVTVLVRHIAQWLSFLCSCLESVRRSPGHTLHFNIILPSTPTGSFLMPFP